MYTSFYNLEKKPFEQNPDPSFLWLGAKYKEAFSTLLYGILGNKGFLLLTGLAGSGKTILIKALTQRLDKDVEWAVLADPSLERIEFYNAIARGFGIEEPFTSKVQFLLQFSHFLHKADDENKKVLLLVDDCHLLSQEMLEELRLLSNIEQADAKLINIFFVGQPEFNDILLQPKNRAVKQRLTLQDELDSLNLGETGDYIRHRLKVAGTEDKLFSAKAVQGIHRFSQGVPRRINAICDRALVSGSAQNILTIDQKVIELCVRKMDLPVSSSHRDFAVFPDEESEFDYFNTKYINQPTEDAPSFSGFNFENDSQRGWLKYGFGFLVVLVVGACFLFPALRHQESDQKIPVEIIKVPVVKSVFHVNSSPAVTMLEENSSGIDEKEAAELKTAVLKKAYSSNEEKEKAEDFQPKETLRKISEIASEVPPPVEVSEKALVAPVAEPQVERQDTSVAIPVAPLEPRKIVLGLRSSSLELTSLGQKELKNFIEKLKLYPRATVYVKGYVSAKSNSPENIKLSEDRALSVQKLMLEKGIEAEQVEAMGMGNQDPIASNNTSEGRRKNRRVEVVVIDDGI